ncbi:unannotated protein [freshwater metagenome]|uniref:Unannotated protein n=1 Tax=freshwater metagenome TaxID=449393 RepID=A0A6J6IDP0_9ZZZZ|nr:hypothetical protein [Actinomycetota bacterium]
MIPPWAEAAGYAAAVMSITSASSQFIRFARVRSAQGVATGTWLLLSVSTVAWFAYAIGVRSPQQIVANGSWMFVIIPLTWLMLRGRSGVAALSGIVVIGATLVFFVALGHKWPAFPGWIGAPASLLMTVPQIRYSLRHGRGPGVSLVAWVTISISAFLWFVYGVGAGEAPVFVNSFMQTILSSTVVLVLIARPMALEPAGDAEFVTGRIGDVEVALAPNRI